VQDALELGVKVPQELLWLGRWAGGELLH
jgi:hypothetical protein